MRESDWNEDEFVTLLRNLDKSDEELSRLTGRSVGATGGRVRTAAM